MYQDQFWDQFFWDCHWNTLWDKIFSIICISSENDISAAETLRVTDFKLTFYLEICEIQRLFWDQIFRYQYWDFFETKILETNSKTYFETENFKTVIEPFCWDQIFSRPILRFFWDRYQFSQKKWKRSRYQKV